jgi:nitrile hydratase
VTNKNHTHEHGHDHNDEHGHDHNDDHSHHHDHEHAHHHFPSAESYRTLDRLIQALVAKSVVTLEELKRTQIETEKGDPKQGARMVVRAWSDPAYRERLLADGSTAAEEMGYSMIGSPPLGVLENTPAVHNLVVCTLCSCYPRKLLGYPPDWYKSDAYRARAVRDPRGLLSEWGVKLPLSTQIHIVDSTADYRWMVLPMRPAGTEQFSEEQLFDLLTRDCLVGAGLPQADSSVSAQNT